MTAIAPQPDVKPLHLHALQVSNFMKVEALSIDARGNHVVISGANNAGKTTSVNAIFVALAGYSAKDMPDPVQHGKDDASITLDLGDYIITRKFTAKNKSTSLTVRLSDGTKIIQPQGLLDSFLSEYSLDPGAFLTKREQDQIDDILAVCGIKPPVEEVQRITGENIPVRAGESADQYLARLSADETGLFYDRRRQQGRVVESKKKAQGEALEDLERIGGRPRPDERTASTEGLVEQLQAQQALQKTYQSMVAERDAKVREANEAEAAAGRYTQASTENNREAEQVATQIALLQERLEKLRASADDNLNRAQGALEQAAILRKEAQALSADIAAEQDPSVRIGELNRDIKEAGEHSRRLGERDQAARFLDTMTAEHAKAVEEHERIDGILTELRSLRRNILNGVNLDIEGLSIEDGHILLGGTNLKQCGNAWRMKLACAVATKQNPRLKLLRVDDGERFDEETEQMLFSMAQAKGWQIVMTRVARKGDLTVEIVDAEPAGQA